MAMDATHELIESEGPGDPDSCNCGHWDSNQGPHLEHVLGALVSEWGVRFPSGAVQVQEDEASARRISVSLNGLRPDLPTLVVRKIVTDWAVPEQS